MWQTASLGEMAGSSFHTAAVVKVDCCKSGGAVGQLSPDLMDGQLRLVFAGTITIILKFLRFDGLVPEILTTE